jgi:hypothetical protein
MHSLQFRIRLLLIVSFLIILTLACSLGQTKPTPEPDSPAPPTKAAVLHPTITPPPTTAPTAIPPAEPTTAAAAPTVADPTQPAAELPPAPEAVGPASPVASHPGFTGTSITRLQSDDNGGVWAVSPHLAARWNGADWAEVVESPNALIVGADGLGVIWAITEDGASIQAWEAGTWQIYGEAEGWAPVIVDIPYSYGRPLLETDSAGHIWYPTGQDVRRFDGQTWITYTLADLNMDPFEPEEGYPHQFIVHILPGSPEVWLTECDWIGPGPFGDRGVRWFDGQAWQGSNSGPQEGCSYVMTTGPDGTVWANVDDKLWKRSPQGSWISYDLPAEPDLFRRPAGLLDMVIDPNGQLWAILLGCGGAACELEQPYRFDTNGGGWQLIEGSDPYDYRLDFVVHTDGSTWLFSWDNGIYRVADTTLEPVANTPSTRHPLLAEDGRIYFVSYYKGYDWLWVFTP